MKCFIKLFVFKFWNVLLFLFFTLFGFYVILFYWLGFFSMILNYCPRSSELFSPYFETVSIHCTYIPFSLEGEWNFYFHLITWTSGSTLNSALLLNFRKHRKSWDHQRKEEIRSVQNPLTTSEEHELFLFSVDQCSYFLVTLKLLNSVHLGYKWAPNILQITVHVKHVHKVFKRNQLTKKLNIMFDLGIFIEKNGYLLIMYKTSISLMFLNLHITFPSKLWLEWFKWTPSKAHCFHYFRKFGLHPQLKNMIRALHTSVGIC